MLTLEAKNRNIKENLASLRKGGFVPAVFYGKKEESTPITISSVQFQKVLKEAGESTVITLKRSEGDVEALIHDVDFDPVTGNPIHVDFYVFEKGQKLTLDVALEYVGVSAGVKDFGGLLVKVLHEIKIEAMPKDLPSQIEVDISPLTTIGSQILAKDLVLPAGVTLVENPDEVVALVSAPKEEKEEDAAPIDLSAIEVEKKGKEKNAEEGEVSEGEAKE
jgi:large subunit ribosomal protein L25